MRKSIIARPPGRVAELCLDWTLRAVVALVVLLPVWDVVRTFARVTP